MSKTEQLINVPQNEFRISMEKDTVLTTILGSCVATCLWDHKTGVGGMNHILLPSTQRYQSAEFCESVNLMEILINSILKSGGVRRNLKAKIFGGASMFDRSGGIGEQNQSFALWFLENENIEIVSQSIGGNRGRKLKFRPHNGSAQMKFLDDAWQNNRIQSKTIDRSPKPKVGADITLF